MKLQVNDHVLVLGAGISGAAMAAWALRHGADVTVVDTRDTAQWRDGFLQRLPEVVAESVTGFEASLLDRQRYTCVARSQGLSPAQVGELRAAGQERGIPMVGEVDLFASGLQIHAPVDRPEVPVLAITGTNGKTTVTSLTAHLLRHAGWDVAVGGNIGLALLDMLSQRLDAQTWPDAWVIELASFQLDDAQHLQAQAATILNITEDHLDWHADMEDYARAKQRIFGLHTHRVLNRQDVRVMALRPNDPPKRPKAGAVLPPTWCTFGVDLPQRPGDWGIESINGMDWLVRALADDSNEADASGVVPVYMQRLMPADAMRIRGRHNASNALAALALATSAGAPLAAMLHGLREYAGEPHRVQSVAVVNDVEYFDDSKGTNVGATLAAIEGLGAERRLVLIMGGDGKGQDFSALKEPVQRHARAVLLIGRDALRLKEALQGVECPVQTVGSLEDAVQQATQFARPGDAVLMSPACASLDMFRNYSHRAEVFVQAVNDWAQAQGVCA